MKIHLGQIPQGGHLEGEEECPIADLAREKVICTAPLRYAIDVGVSSEALWANGRLEQPVKLECVACLQQFDYTIVVKDFAVHTPLHGPELVDLTPFVREDLLLNLPAHPHCDQHGGRACQPRTTTDVEDEAERAQRKREADWSALDKLRLKR